jgi:hypothetical protein
VESFDASAPTKTTADKIAAAAIAGVHCCNADERVRREIDRRGRCSLATGVKDIAGQVG